VEIVRSLFSERIFGFKEIVEANIYEPVAMERLAALTNHSLTSFKKEFKRIYNTTPGAYIIRKRVERVADLLTFSDEDICRIGYQCGFTSPAHLSRVFKSRYGITPSEYRSQSINV
jgi:transcriptional regulator GlxA family with amidase domain